MNDDANGSENFRKAAVGLKGLGTVSGTVKRGPAPVHLWDPPYCGEIDMRIAANGTWFHEGTPIGRPALVKLFASILKREPDGRIYLVTPVEKVGITVEDVPFVAVDLDVLNGGGADQMLTFVSSVGDRAVAGADHRLRFVADPETGGLRPYVHIRGGMDALVNRATTHELLALAEPAEVDGADWLGIRSGGQFFPIAPMSDVDGEWL